MAVTNTLLGDDAGIVRDRSFQILLLANLTSPLGPALVSPLLDTLTGVFGASEGEIGLMISAYTAPGIVIIPLVGVLVDRYGRKPVLVSGLLLFGLAGTAIASTTDFRVVLALRVLQGVGGAGIVPVIITSIGDLYEGAEEATAQGLRLSTSGLTQAVFPAIAGFMVVLAWQYPLFLYAISFPVAAAVALWLEEPADETVTTDGGRDGGPPASDGGDPEPKRLVTLASRRDVLAVLVGRALPGFCYFGFITYNSIVVVRVLGGTPADAGLLVALGSVVYAVAASQAGRVTARFDSRAPPMVSMFLALGVGLGLVAATGSLLVTAVGVVFVGAGFGTLGSLYRSVITGLAPGLLRGRLVSVSESVGRVGITAAPILMGALVGALRPSLGLPTAVRLTLVAVGVGGALAGVASVLVGEVDPRVAGT